MLICTHNVDKLIAIFQKILQKQMEQRTYRMTSLKEADFVDMRLKRSLEAGILIRNRRREDFSTTNPLGRSTTIIYTWAYFPKIATRKLGNMLTELYSRYLYPTNITESWEKGCITPIYEKILQRSKRNPAISK